MHGEVFIGDAGISISILTGTLISTTPLTGTNTPTR
jgi:hypothetical protein